MCYIIESKQQFDVNLMTATVEKSNTDINFVKVWITSNNDFLVTTSMLESFLVPFQFTVPFGEIRYTQITIKESMIKPLNCKKSDTEYVSEWQCFVNIFINEHFSQCPIKCIPIQMIGFNYVNKSISLPNCAIREDEICMGGPKVWNTLNNEFSKCPKPCKMITYKDSQLELREPTFLKTGQTLANFKLIINSIRKIEKEALVYDTNDAIGAIGGSLGLFLGFSFFDVISKFLDNLIMRLVNYLVSLQHIQ
jgi:hypothetical protein